jgi:general secretion pathway protein K
VSASAPSPSRSPESVPRDRDQGRRGVVLIMALWTLVLLSALAGSAIYASRFELQISRNAIEQAQGRALAEAGITWGIAKLLEHDSPDPWPIDGTPRRIRFAGAEIDVSIQDELGKIDLNAASEQTLRALFVAAGASESEAERLTDTLADWRDADDEAHPKGAERAAYEAQGYRYGPRNGPLESVAELEQIAAVRSDLVRILVPATTVHTRQPFIDPSAATNLTIEATTSREYGRPEARSGAAGRTTDAIPDLTGRTFTVQADDKLGGPARRITLRFTGQVAHPFLIGE